MIRAGLLEFVLHRFWVRMFVVVNAVLLIAVFLSVAAVFFPFIPVVISENTLFVLVMVAASIVIVDGSVLKMAGNLDENAVNLSMRCGSPIVRALGVVLGLSLVVSALACFGLLPGFNLPESDRNSVMTLLGPYLFQSVSVLYLISRRRIMKKYTITVDYRELLSGPLDIRTHGRYVIRGMLGTISLILLMVVIVFLYVLL